MTAPKVFGIAALLGALAAPGAPPAHAATAEHEIRPGDNLHLLAGYYYKDPRRWREIWKANRARVRNASVLPVGAVLRVELDDGSAWDIPYEEFVALVRRGR